VSDERELRSSLVRGLEELESPHDDFRVDALLRLTAKLAAWAPRINLTAHLEPHAIVHRLILDAAALARALPPAERMVDIGSGAGFPGLVIAILEPTLDLISIESRGKRVSFQRDVVRSLGLRNVEILQDRAENLAPRPCDVVVAQAVARPELALRLMLPWSRARGWLAIPGTTHDFGGSLEEIPDIEGARVLDYQVPCGGASRTLWIARKV
jgi:16S rRNA (guanine527-N7)-methyltransferase